MLDYDRYMPPEDSVTFTAIALPCTNFVVVFHNLHDLWQSMVLIDVQVCKDWTPSLPILFDCKL